MKYYKLKLDEIYKELNTTEFGLSKSEAKKRLLNNGKNKLDEPKQTPKFIVFLKGFNNLMIIILLIATVISFVVAYYENSSYIDSMIILAIVILNAFLSFIQEQKADQSLKALKNMQVTKTLVKRNKTIKKINIESLVVGDIILLEAGDTVPADARIIESINLKIDESSLTGESITVKKENCILKEKTPLAEQKNMIFSGTNIAQGKCEAVIIKTGMNTQMGEIAKTLLDTKVTLTPLQMKINSISKVLSILAIISIFIMFIIGLYQQMEFFDLFILSISLAVAAIPEGLPAVITIILSVGMSQMAKNKVIVRKMSSVETLGCTQVICSDKTGTITQNKMKVIKTYYDYHTFDKIEDKLFSLNVLLCNNVIESDKKLLGDPTEIALYEFIENKEKYERLSELPFDSIRKMMSVSYKIDEKEIMFVKGSFDSIITNCTHILINNKKLKLTKDIIAQLTKVEEQNAKEAYRILAFAYKETNDLLEENLIFQGMVMMIDPPREGVKESIAQCISAGIKPIMITGDSLNTAIAIARNVGILKNDDEAITGEELDKLSEKELEKNVLKYSVYARVSPKNKYDIVNMIKKRGKVVAMTGDGVNDAPALKNADIGVGMGITGTEVTKNVADIILTDDNFTSIVLAIKEGRRIYDNIKNVLVYLLSTNIAEVLVIFIGMIFGFEVFLPIQILYINLISDSIPAISLAFEKSEDNIINKKPRNKSSNFFTPFLIAKISSAAILKTISILFVFFTSIIISDIKTATTLSFLALIILEIFFAFSCKNLKNNILNKNIFNNKYLNMGTLILIIMQLLVFMTPLRNLFNLTQVTLNQFLSVLLLNIIIIFIDEHMKKNLSKNFKDE